MPVILDLFDHKQQSDVQYNKGGRLHFNITVPCKQSSRNSHIVDINDRCVTLITPGDKTSSGFYIKVPVFMGITYRICVNGHVVCGSHAFVYAEWTDGGKIVSRAHVISNISKSIDVSFTASKTGTAKIGLLCATATKHTIKLTKFSITNQKGISDRPNILVICTTKTNDPAEMLTCVLNQWYDVTLWVINGTTPCNSVSKWNTVTHELNDSTINNVKTSTEPIMVIKYDLHNNIYCSLIETAFGEEFIFSLVNSCPITLVSPNEFLNDVKVSDTLSKCDYIIPTNHALEAILRTLPYATDKICPTITTIWNTDIIKLVLTKTYATRNGVLIIDYTSSVDMLDIKTILPSGTKLYMYTGDVKTYSDIEGVIHVKKWTQVPLYQIKLAVFCSCDTIIDIVSRKVNEVIQHGILPIVSSSYSYATYLPPECIVNDKGDLKYKISNIVSSDIPNLFLTESRGKLLITSTQSPSNGGAATNAYQLIKYYRYIGYKVAGIFFNTNLECDPEHIGGIWSVTQGPIISMLTKMTIRLYLGGDPDYCLCKNYRAPTLTYTMFPDKPIYYMVSGIDTYGRYLDSNTTQGTIKSATDLLSPDGKETLDTLRTYMCDDEIKSLIVAEKVLLNSNISYQLLSHIVPEHADKMSIGGQIPNPIVDCTDAVILTNDNIREIDIIYVVSSTKRLVKNSSLVRDIFTSPELEINTKTIVGIDDDNMFNDQPIKIDVIGHIPRDKVMQYMSQSKILLCTSYFDSAPNVIPEALSAGCKIITTHNVGIPTDIIEKYSTNIIILDSFDVSTWIKCITAHLCIKKEY